MEKRATPEKRSATRRGWLDQTKQDAFCDALKICLLNKCYLPKNNVPSISSFAYKVLQSLIIQILFLPQQSSELNSLLKPSSFASSLFPSCVMLTSLLRFIAHFLLPWLYESPFFFFIPLPSLSLTPILFIFPWGLLTDWTVPPLAILTDPSFSFYCPNTARDQPPFSNLPSVNTWDSYNHGNSSVIWLPLPSSMSII